MRSIRGGKPKLLYAEHEGGEDDQLAVEILYKKKRYGGYLPFIEEIR